MYLHSTNKSFIDANNALTSATGNVTTKLYAPGTSVPPSSDLYKMTSTPTVTAGKIDDTRFIFQNLYSKQLTVGPSALSPVATAYAVSGTAVASTQSGYKTPQVWLLGSNGSYNIGSYMGSVAGYSTGGETTLTSRFSFSFSSGLDSQILPSLSAPRYAGTGASSSEYGHDIAALVSGGYNSGTIRFPFASPAATESSHASLPIALVASSAAQSSTHAFTHGGFSSPLYYGNIFKYPFATTTAASSYATLPVAAAGTVGHTSANYGYSTGGYISAGNYQSTTTYYPFSSPATFNLVSHLSPGNGRSSTQGISSEYYAFVAGGTSSGTDYQNVVHRFPFASTATDKIAVGNLRKYTKDAGCYSTHEYGIVLGGYGSPFFSGPYATLSTSDSFPYSTPWATASDFSVLGNPAVRYMSSTQY
jgi:hypothetical protein